MAKKEVVKKVKEKKIEEIKETNERNTVSKAEKKVVKSPKKTKELKEKKVKQIEVDKKRDKVKKESIIKKPVKENKVSKKAKEVVKGRVKEDLSNEKKENKVIRKEPKANDILLFGRWDSEDVEIKDMGLAQYINVKNILVPNAHGRHAKKQFYKSDLNIVERLLNRMYVAGHRGKRHKIFSGQNIGKSQKLWGIIEDAFEIIEKQTKKNPVQVLVTAIENAAPKEEVITYQRGGQMARKPVVVSSQRRIDLALRMLTQGAYENRLNNKMSAAESLAKDIIAAFKNDRCKAIMEKERREKEAKGAR